MLVQVRTASVPSASGPMLVDEHGVPRFWPTVWLSFSPAGRAKSTVVKALRHIESFYGYAATTVGADALETAIAECDLDCLLDALEGYFFALKNHPPLTSASEERWQAAIQFVIESTQRVARVANGIGRLHALQSRLNEFRLSTGHLYLGRRRNPERVRSLPAEVVEALYEVLNPTSPQNPFKGAKSRWRVHTIFILMLHQGLRRSELLLLPTDAVKRGIDRKTHEVRCWMSVKFNEYEDDPRYSTPSIKNATSVRQIPVSEATAAVVNDYVANYRGKPNHSFLMNSQWRLPLSTERITQIFAQISRALPDTVRGILREHTDENSITPHDLRHTCAVVRLNQLLASGVEMNDALEQLRAFFGWARDSDMPLRYARVVFEHRLASVWNSTFDDRIEILRSIPTSMT